MTTVRAGGTTVRLPETVMFFDLERRRPVYHRAADDFETRRNEQGETEWWRVSTHCGETTYEEEGETVTNRGTSIPARHAKRFGRPCLICWPELRTGQLELKEAPL